MASGSNRHHSDHSESDEPEINLLSNGEMDVLINLPRNSDSIFENYHNSEPNERIVCENDIQHSDKTRDTTMNFNPPPKDSFQHIECIYIGDESNDGDDLHPTSTSSRMQQVLIKFRPYLSSPEDERNLIKRLNNLGVECVEDLKFLNFERDLQGIMKLIPCRKLKTELSKDESINRKSVIHKASSSTVEHERSPSIQTIDLTIPHFEGLSSSTVKLENDSEMQESRSVERILTPLNIVFKYKMPRFKQSVRTCLETGLVTDSDRLYIIRTMSKPMFDVKSNPGMNECKAVVRMLEMQFPNAFENNDSGFCAKYVLNKLISRVHYLKQKNKNKLMQNNHAFSKISNRTKIKFGTHTERFAPAILSEKDSVQDHIKLNLKHMHGLYTNEKQSVDLNDVTKYMKDTYAEQRRTITSAETIQLILSEWPFLGKALYMKTHFHYLTNTNEAAIFNFKEKIPSMLKFLQTEAEKKLKNNHMQIKLTTIIKNEKNRNTEHHQLLTVLLCCMAMMNQNADLMFIILKDTNTLDELPSSSQIPSTPVVVCLGDLWSNPQCFVFVDKQRLWHEPMGIVGGIHIMFMSYYVFNIEYPEKLADILQFLQSLMFNIKDENNEKEKCVPKLLRLINKYYDFVEKGSS